MCGDISLGDVLFILHLLSFRMESLKAALALVMPIENEWVLLCRSEEQLCKRDIPRCMMSRTDLLYKKVKVCTDHVKIFFGIQIISIHLQ